MKKLIFATLLIAFTVTGTMAMTPVPKASTSMDQKKKTGKKHHARKHHKKQAVKTVSQ